MANAEHVPPTRAPFPAAPRFWYQTITPPSAIDLTASVRVVFSPSGPLASVHRGFPPSGISKAAHSPPDRQESARAACDRCHLED